MKRWETVLGTRSALLLVLGLVLLVAAGSLTVGFVTDDQGFRAALHSTSAHARASWDLFRFTTGDPAANEQAIRFGHLPWWAAPTLRIHFLRPLTSLLFVADDHLFGDSPLGYHVHSLVWLAVLLTGVAAFYRRVLPPTAALLALATFGFAAAHVQGYAWLSARHVIVGAAGAAWALAACAHGGRTRWLGWLALTIGLLGSEAALGAIPLWCAVAWRSDDGATPRARLLACTPAVVLGVAYLVAYHVLGGGTRASGGYHDPFTDPLGFLRLALVRVPILLGDVALGIPAELAHVAPSGILALIGLAATGLLALGWWLTRPAASPRQGMIGWLVVAGLLATLPGAAGYPAGRVLVVPDLGFAAAIGCLLARGLSARPSGQLLAALLALVHLVVAPLHSWHEQRALTTRGRAVDAIAQRVTELVPPGGRAFLIAADPLVFLYPRGVLAQTAPGAVTCWSVLSAAHAGHTITRVDDHTLSITAVERPLLDGSFDVLFRGPGHPFAVGDAVEQCGAELRIAAVHDGLPTQLTVHFRRRLDDPVLTFLVWRDRQLQRLVLPPAGQTVDVPWSRGPLGRL